MVKGYVIIKKGDMVDILPDTYPGNIIHTGTGWVKKVEKCKNGSTTMSMKLDINGLICHNKPLKGVTKVDVLNRVYRNPHKKRKFCDDIINKETKKTNNTDNGLHVRIDPKLQNM